MELLQLDAQYVRDQLQATGKFLPESFYQHGGDGDGIQVALLFPSLNRTLNVLSSQLRNKVRIHHCNHLITFVQSHLLLLSSFYTTFRSSYIESILSVCEDVCGVCV